MSTTQGKSGIRQRAAQYENVVPSEKTCPACPERATRVEGACPACPERATQVEGACPERATRVEGSVVEGACPELAVALPALRSFSEGGSLCPRCGVEGVAEGSKVLQHFSPSYEHPVSRYQLPTKKGPILNRYRPRIDANPLPCRLLP